nr:GNAT family N-acetyltransferase [Sulfitobacter aestuariivivens]
MDAPHVALHPHSHGFALSRTVAGESELLTLAVDPACQRQGIAWELLKDWLASATPHADTAFLEVAADNGPAIALYLQAGFAEIARRPSYYHRQMGEKVDALIFQRALTRGHSPETVF